MSETYVNFIEKNGDDLEERMALQQHEVVHLPRGNSKEAIDKRWEILLNQNKKLDEQRERNAKKEAKKTEEQKQSDKKWFFGIKEELYSEKIAKKAPILSRNIENFIGTIKIPVAVAGPLKVNGLFAKGEFFVPMATTEAALLASYNRGMACINKCGGITAAIIEEGISRDPNFCFKGIKEVGEFLVWSRKNEDKYKEIAKIAHPRGDLETIKYMVDANNVHMKFIFVTGNDIGTAVATICVDEISKYIKENSPAKPEYVVLEGGLSGEKKANRANSLGVRGYKVVGEVVLKKNIIREMFKVDPKDIVRGTIIATNTYNLLNPIGMNAHCSNGFTAVALALGIDSSLGSEGHAGNIRTAVTKDGDLYIGATMNNLVIGTINPGNKLPTSRACLEILGLYGDKPNNSKKLAEILIGVLIGGDLSLGCAMMNGNFAKAHQVLARDTDTLVVDIEKDGLDQAFIKCQAFLVKLDNNPALKDVLKLYALFKQATVGDCNIDKPNLLASIRDKKKYDSWVQHKGIEKEDAKKQYVELALRLAEEDKEAKKKSVEEFEKKHSDVKKF